MLAFLNMQFEDSAFVSQWSYPALPAFQTYPISHALAASSDLTRLYVEKEILEKGLADCVTYLHALRGKKSRIDRQIETGSKLPRRKRKQIQAIHRQLERDIKNRERSEEACLNNLQACRANIYVLESLSSPSTGILSAIPAFTSGSTRQSDPAESVPTEMSWNGWADDAATSPFQKQTKNVFFVNEVAPDEVAIDMDEGVFLGGHQTHLLEHVNGLGITTSSFADVQPATVLSPEAPVFRPRGISTGMLDIIAKAQVAGAEKVGSRRATLGDATQTRHQSYNSRPTPQGSCIKTCWAPTPQHSPSKASNHGGVTRERTKSL